jgi:hypothetical protein
VTSATTIRNVRPDDLDEVWRVHVASSSDSAMRRGRPARRADGPVSPDTRAALASDPDGYFCAVEDGRIRGKVSALVRMRALPCDPAVAEKLTAEVFGDGRADDLARWRRDGCAAVAVARGGDAGVTMRVPGACASLLEAAVASGFRIGELAVFLASRTFGRPELYLPSGPILF